MTVYSIFNENYNAAEAIQGIIRAMSGAEYYIDKGCNVQLTMEIIGNTYAFDLDSDCAEALCMMLLHLANKKGYTVDLAQQTVK